MTNKIKSIVITGGPCSGKTTLIGILRGIYPDLAVFIPEAATLLLSGGWPPPTDDCPRWKETFQAAVIAVQLNLEKTYQRIAKQQGKCLMICDRGLMDSEAYLRNACRKSNIDPQQALARYDRVIHLESLATAWPSEYEKKVSSNPCRYENLHQARALELATRHAWAKHPHHRIVLNGTDILDVVTKTMVELMNS